MIAMRKTHLTLTALVLVIASAIVGVAYLVGDPLLHSIELTTYDMRDRKSTRLNSSHMSESRMPSSA